MSEAPLWVASADGVEWDDTADLVVVGFGGAGVVASIEARERGLSVIALDRFNGGGATAASGGVNYAGGTRYQKEAGFADTPDEMFKYLSAEGAPVAAETLQRFCQESSANLDWLSAHGVPYSGRAYLEKTAYPPDSFYLYYSGNEKHPQYSAVARPAPRGHRPVGSGFGGVVHFGALREAALAAGVKLMRHAPVRRLVIDAEGRVVGIEACIIPQSAWKKHDSLNDRVKAWAPFSGKSAEKAIAAAADFERQFTERRLIRAYGGVLLSSGGFAYNLALLKRHRPEIAKAYKAVMRLGKMGCDGSGIILGESAGGVADLMDRVFVGRNISPPNGLVKGIIVNSAGKRFINEDVYTNLLGEAISRQPETRAWLILNAADFWESFKWALRPGKGMFLPFGLPVLLNALFGGTRRAGNLHRLAQKCGIDPAGLIDTAASYDAGAAAGADQFGKGDAYLHKLGAGPFYALNMALGNACALTPVFTLGGLRVGEGSGAVLNADGAPIAGLYVAGRTAVGLCSFGYMSGMAIADTVFSGRRAGRSVAAALAADGGNVKTHQEERDDAGR